MKTVIRSLFVLTIVKETLEKRRNAKLGEIFLNYEPLYGLKPSSDNDTNFE